MDRKDKSKKSTGLFESGIFITFLAAALYSIGISYNLGFFLYFPGVSIFSSSGSHYQFIFQGFLLCMTLFIAIPFSFIGESRKPRSCWKTAKGNFFALYLAFSYIGFFVLLPLPLIDINISTKVWVVRGGRLLSIFLFIFLSYKRISIAHLLLKWRPYWRLFTSLILTILFAVTVFRVGWLNARHLQQLEKPRKLPPWITIYQSSFPVVCITKQDDKLFMPDKELRLIAHNKGNYYLVEKDPDPKDTSVIVVPDGEVKKAIIIKKSQDADSGLMCPP